MGSSCMKSNENSKEKVKRSERRRERTTTEGRGRRQKRAERSRSDKDGKRTVLVCDWLYGGTVGQFLAFLHFVLKGAHYQRAIVKFWSRDETPLDRRMFSLLPLKVRPVNVIYRCAANTRNECLENVMFEELHLGDSDNV